MNKKIGILATGNEIVNGDILNTNGRNIAQQLLQHHMTIGKHVIVTDDEKDLQSGLAYLLQDHDAIITIGGLGPTCDDRTRFAVSTVTKQALVFDDNAWSAITQRMLVRCTDTVIPSNNKQQALFPEGATRYPNPHGTAQGCMCKTAEAKLIFMLPGPPSECLPMFDHYVLPALHSNTFSKQTYLKSWLLFNVSESHIADTIDQLTEKYKRTTGYRISYPYLECKIACENKHDLDALSTIIENEVEPHLINNSLEPASKQLYKYLLNNKISLSIDDQVTGGMLCQRLLTPKVFSHIRFNDQKPDIKITGLTNYWQANNVLTCKIGVDIKGTATAHTIPLRGHKTLLHTTELICIDILRYFSVTTSKPS
jgi:nicotinamide-nucleotide amidase